MTDRPKKAFSGGKVFVPFLTCGDPNIETTEKLMLAMADAGADLIELGVPFSDPTGEGPVIMSANIRALSAGVTVDDVFDMVARLRKKTDVPLAFMTYANVVFSRGTEEFVRRMARVGADALILTDVPLEEKDEFALPCARAGIKYVSIVSPASSERVDLITRRAEGFVQFMSPLGVADEIGGICTDIAEAARRINAAGLPCIADSEISTSEQAKRMSWICDGVVVGSAIVRLIAEHGEDCVPYVTELVKAMKSAVRG